MAKDEGHLLKSDHIVTGLDIGHALSNRLDHASTFVAKNDGESSLGVLSGESVCIWERGVSSKKKNGPTWGELRPRTSVADTSVVDLNADFVGLGRRNLDVLDGQRLASCPCDGGLLLF
jgi:hypothetical protein